MDKMREWLARLGLARYTSKFEECRYDSMKVLHSISLRDEDVKELVTDTGMLKGHAKHFCYRLSKSCSADEKSKPCKVEPALKDNTLIDAISCSEVKGGDEDIVVTAVSLKGVRIEPVLQLLQQCQQTSSGGDC